jgi:hypothetical protein
MPPPILLIAQVDEGRETHTTADIRLVNSFSIDAHSLNAARSGASANYPIDERDSRGGAYHRSNPEIAVAGEFARQR